VLFDTRLRPLGLEEVRLESFDKTLVDAVLLEVLCAVAKRSTASVPDPFVCKSSSLVTFQNQAEEPCTYNYCII
jgi:hypothetical protein